MGVFNYIMSAITTAAIVIAPLCAEEQMRAAIDFGSGAVKIQLALVDTEKNEIVSPLLLAKFVPLTLMEDMEANGGVISEKTQQKAIEILTEFKREAIEIAIANGKDSVAFSGIGTAAFRKATNGAELLNTIEKQVGIPFRILEQQAEGKLGFVTAKALYPDIEEKKLIAWDSGGGSFQLTYSDLKGYIRQFKDLPSGKMELMKMIPVNNYEVFQGPLGHGTVRVMLSRDIRKGEVLQQDESGNPVTAIEAEKLIKLIKKMLPNTRGIISGMPAGLKKRLADKEVTVVAFGEGESIFALTAQAAIEGKESLLEATITLEQVKKVISLYTGQNDAFFDARGMHRKTLTSALLLYSVMDQFGIEKVSYKRAIGSTDGMLISPELWSSKR